MGRAGELLDARRLGRDRGRVPGIDEDPQWTIVFDGFPRTRADAATVESMTTLANGEIGVRGVFEDDGEGTPMVVAPGVFDERGDTPTLLAGPNWTSLVMLPESNTDDRRVLDLRTGMLLRERRPPARGLDAGEKRVVRTLRFVPLEQGPSGVLLAEGPLECHGARADAPPAEQSSIRGGDEEPDAHYRLRIARTRGDCRVRRHG